MRTRASGATGPRNAMRSVSAAGVGASSRSAADSSMPESSESETSTSTAESESPPSSKKSSADPTRSRPSACAKTPATAVSAGPSAARAPPSGPNGGGSASGSGRALRSTLPDAVRGSRSRKTKAAGTMYAGSALDIASRISAIDGSDRSSRTIHATRRGLSARPTASTTASRIPARPSRTPSTSPTSTRCPRILSRDPLRPAYSRQPSGSSRPRSPVRYMRTPGRPGTARNAAAVCSGSFQ